MTGRDYCAVYDFGLMPYALGDVLTWNVQTAIQCEDLGRARVNVFICLDERHPSSIYQRDLVTAENSGLFFSELFGAFGTHPKLGSVFLYRDREDLRERLREEVKGDAASSGVVTDYEQALADRKDDDALIRYFTRYIYSHERINDFAKRNGRIPMLRPSMGCEPDVSGLLASRFAGKRIVAIHIRLRRLDTGFGGQHTYARDSDFLEYYEFLREAGARHPDVQFVVLGRAQEKPLELLKLPNVMSLRAVGLGLGHELTLMLRSDLFIGSSSGFAAMANFSEISYFVTRMTRESCKAYGIEYGAERLPFATERQVLVYEPETRELLMRLLERGLGGTTPHRIVPGPAMDPGIDVRSWEWERSRWLHPNATIYRYFDDATFSDKETAYLLWPRVKDARRAWRRGLGDRALAILERIETSFPRLCDRFPEFLRLRVELAAARNDTQVLARCKARLTRLTAQQQGPAGWARWINRILARGYPAAMRLKHYWRRKHRIPWKLAARARNFVSRLSGR